MFIRKAMICLIGGLLVLWSVAAFADQVKDVNVVNTPDVTVTNMPDVNVANTPDVNVANVPEVLVTNDENSAIPVTIQNGAQNGAKTPWMADFNLQFTPGDLNTVLCTTYYGQNVLTLQNINGGMGQGAVDNPQFRLQFLATNGRQVQYFFAARQLDRGPGTFSESHFVQESFRAYVYPGTEICVSAWAFSRFNFANSFRVTLAGIIDESISLP